MCSELPETDMGRIRKRRARRSGTRSLASELTRRSEAISTCARFESAASIASSVSSASEIAARQRLPSSFDSRTPRDVGGRISRRIGRSHRSLAGVSTAPVTPQDRNAGSLRGATPILPQSFQRRVMGQLAWSDFEWLLLEGQRERGGRPVRPVRKSMCSTTGNATACWGLFREVMLCDPRARSRNRGQHRSRMSSARPSGRAPHRAAGYQTR